MRIVNYELIVNPYNWVVVWLMLLFAALFFTLVNNIAIAPPPGAETIKTAIEG